MATSTDRECPYELPAATNSFSVKPSIEKHETVLLLIVGFAGFSFIIGLIYNILRRKVFRDFHNLDVIFDAGGRVSLSLTAVTVTSQLMWATDFLQGPTIANKTGVSGALWYQLAIVISILMFPLLGIRLKTCAPGAKTFPQIALARFGRPAHLMFCVIAILTNLVVIANQILAGITGLQVLTKNISDEIVILLLAVLFGSYCFIGGLGTTFYISYFNTAMTFIITSVFIFELDYLAEPEVKERTASENLYNAVACLKGPEGNTEDSFLTFQSESGLIYAVVVLFIVSTNIFMDQANWQSRIAAKPWQGIVGFLLAAFLWFCIPTFFTFVVTMTYKAMSFKNGTNLLTDDEINQGYIAPFVMQTLLGKHGSFLLLTLLAMTLMSTGSGEVMSLSSIVVYDILKVYIFPFRKNMAPTECPLCGVDKAKTVGHDEVWCVCPSASDCHECADDIAAAAKLSMYSFQRDYSCKIHGKYRKYEDQLIHYKSWCMAAIVVGIVPYGLLIVGSGMNLNWGAMAAQVFVSPFLPSLFLTITWAGATSKGIISGSIIGITATVTGMFAKASTYEGGLSDFYNNTAEDWSLLTALLSGLVSSSIVIVVVSRFTQNKDPLNVGSDVIKSVSYKLDAAEPTKTKVSDIESPTSMSSRDDRKKMSTKNEWQKTLSIDNPLKPYRDTYRRELKDIPVGEKITMMHLEKIFRRSRKLSYVLAAFSLAVFLVVLPAVGLSHGVLSLEQFSTWISVCQYWCFIGTFFAVLVPPIEEGLHIWKQFKKNKKSSAQ